MPNLFQYVSILLLFLSCSSRETIIKTANPPVQRGDISIAFGNDYLIEEETQTDIIDYIITKRPDVFVFVGHVPLPRYDVKAAFNDLPSTTFVTGVFYPDEYEDFSRFYKYSKEGNDSPRWNMKSSYWSFLVKAPEYKFNIGRYVKVILLDLELNFKKEEGQRELAFLDRELGVDSSIVMYLIISNKQIFSMGKLYEDEIDDDLRIQLMTRFQRVPQAILFASTTNIGPYGEIINYPCDDLSRKVVEISSRGMNAESLPRFDTINSLIVPEIVNTRKDRVFENNYGLIDVFLDVKNIDNSYVWIKLLSEQNDILLSEKLQFFELKRDLKKPVSNFNCTKQLYSNVEKKIVQGMLRNPIFWISFLSMLIPPFLIVWMWTNRARGLSSSGGGGGGWALARNEFEAYHGGY